MSDTKEANELALRMVVTILVQELINSRSIDFNRFIEQIQTSAGETRATGEHVDVADSMHRMSEFLLKLVRENRLPDSQGR